MFELFFGILWLFIIGTVTLIFSFVGGSIFEITGEGGLFSSLTYILFFGMFWAIGIFMVAWGLRKIIRNSQTDKHGETCYGRIIDIKESGKYVNDMPELNAVVKVYVESTRTLEEIEEVIGLATNQKYQIGDYIEGKYYNGDINIASYIPETAIPIYVQDMLKRLINKTEDENTILVDGIEYVKKDTIN